MMRIQPLPPLVSGRTAELILRGELEVSLDLGLSVVNIEYDGMLVYLPGGNQISHEDLELIRKRGNSVFFIDENGIFQVAVSTDHYYKLTTTEGAPTLEIDGIRMHRTKDTTPDEDTRKKLKALKITGGRILDTCNGLGYTAIEAAKLGAEYVVTVERSIPVLMMSRLNPWSSRLYSDDRIHILVGDSFWLVESFPNGFYDYVVHDPPRLTHAGELYSLEFYHRIARVLRIGGSLFHYTGEPGLKYRRRDVRRGVMDRLRAAGFSDLRYIPDALGVVGVKN
jgi:predicted methyltransferase